MVILSYYSKSTHQLVNPNDVFNLNKDISEIVNNILSYRNARSIIGGTTRTAFRRVHEVLASVLDQALTNPQFLKTLQLGIARSLVLIRYQSAREQLSKGLADILINLLNTLMSRIRTSRDKAEIMKLVERGRVVLDSLLVLVYEYGKKR